jgi:hypothetical protein
VPNCETHSVKNLNWRLTELWTLDANDCLEANKDGLQMVYNKVLNKGRKLMNFKDAMSFMCNGGLLVSKNKASKRKEITDIAPATLKALQNLDQKLVETKLGENTNLKRDREEGKFLSGVTSAA